MKLEKRAKNKIILLNKHSHFTKYCFYNKVIENRLCQYRLKVNKVSVKTKKSAHNSPLCVASKRGYNDYKRALFSAILSKNYIPIKLVIGNRLLLLCRIYIHCLFFQVYLNIIKKTSEPFFVSFVSSNFTTS